jgi:hypothetical protein
MVKKMGFGSWFARKGSVGGTARAVAKGWKTIKEKYPEMSPRDIAKTYVNFRYAATKEPDLAEKVLDTLPYDANPLNLSWTIFSTEAENEGDFETLLDHMSEWVQIMKEEIRKCRVEPGEFFYDSK